MPAADFDAHLGNDMLMGLRRQSELLFLDHRALSGLLAGTLLAGQTQELNTAIRTPSTIDQPGVPVKSGA